MTANYVLLEKITVGAAGASSVTFSGIPQTGYTDLVIKYSARSNDTDSTVSLYFNGVNTGTSYSMRNLFGTGSSVLSETFSSQAKMVRAGYKTQSNRTASTFSSSEIYIPNYAGSNYKSISVDATEENNATGSYMGFVAGLWSNTAAITSITLEHDTATTFAQYSTFYLYGVAKLGTTPAIVPYATGGDTIMTDGTYWYHAFKSSGTFTPQKGLSCDVLVVAGGAGGGGAHGGGGGAGGVLNYTSQSLASATNYTVTIGAGGSGGSNAQGSNGSNSQFGSTTAVTGGGGGGYQLPALPYNGSTGSTGGSGGGGGGGNTAGGSGAAGTSGQGSAGGNGAAGSAGGGGGGGGAGAVGSNASGQQGGNAGIGTTAYTSWGSVTGTGQNSSGTFYYGGGGGGGSYVNSSSSPSTGGLGGGGNGGYTSPNHGTVLASVAGTANTGGGGGGGAGNGGNGSAGGSGLVIVRYAV